MSTNCPAGPFTPGDPLSYDELDREARAWRAVLHVLAVTGYRLQLPADLMPPSLLLAVVCGWRYLHEVTAHPDRPDQVLLAATFSGFPEHASPEQVTAYLKTHGTRDPAEAPDAAALLATIQQQTQPADTDQGSR